MFHCCSLNSHHLLPFLGPQVCSPCLCLCSCPACRFISTIFSGFHISLVQSLSHVWLFATPWTATCQASLSITNSQSPPTHVHRVSNAIQPSHPLSSPSPPVSNLSQYQGLFQWVSSSHQVELMLLGSKGWWILTPLLMRRRQKVKRN